MAAKYDQIATLFDEHSKEVAKGREEWSGFLDTAARLYKYQFNEQLLIHAQRPDATACASIELWNDRMHCWVNKGAKGIALMGENSEGRGKLRYVFDVSDVHEARNIGRKPKLWEMREAHKEGVLASLENTYGETDFTKGFSERVMEIADRIAKDQVEDLLPDMSVSLDGSSLAGQSETEIARKLQETLRDTIGYMVLSRCGEDVKGMDIPFSHIHEFDTKESLGVLGSASSDLARPLLMEIGREISAYERVKEKNIEKPLEKTIEQRYYSLNSLEIEEGNVKKEDEIIIDTPDGEKGREDYGTDIRKDGGLSDTEPSDQRGAGRAVDEIRQTDDAVSEGTPPRGLRGDADGREVESPLPTDSGAGISETGHTDEPDGKVGGSGREAEGNGSAYMGSPDEQHQSIGGGDNLFGTDLFSIEPVPDKYEQLSLFSYMPSVDEQMGTLAAAALEEMKSVAAFSLEKSDIDDILRSGSGKENSRKKIYARYEEGKSPEEMQEYLKKIYGEVGKGLTIKGEPVSVWFDENGMKAAHGGSAHEHTIAYYSWDNIEESIRSMVERGDYISETEHCLIEPTEQETIANHFFFFFRDSIGEKPPSIDGIIGYPEAVKKIKGMLETDDGKEQLLAEVKDAVDRLESGEIKIKFRLITTPQELLGELQGLMAEKVIYPLPEKVDVLQENFITQDEIDAAIRGGSSVSQSRMRIQEFFEEGHSHKEAVAFLKDEYGIGGRSSGIIGTDRSYENHDGKGIKLDKGFIMEPYASVLLKWDTVAKRISQMVEADNYLSPAGKEAYAKYKQEKADKAMAEELKNLQAEMPEMEKENAPLEEVAESGGEETQDITTPEVTPVRVAIESSEDYSEPSIGFYTHHYTDGREGERFRLVTIGEDGLLIPYPEHNKFFINREGVEGYIKDHAGELDVVSYDDIVYESMAAQTKHKLEELEQNKELEGFETIPEDEKPTFHEEPEQDTGAEITKSEESGNVEFPQTEEAHEKTVNDITELQEGDYVHLDNGYTADILTSQEINHDSDEKDLVGFDASDGEEIRFNAKDIEEIHREDGELVAETKAMSIS